MALLLIQSLIQSMFFESYESYSVATPQLTWCFCCPLWFCLPELILDRVVGGDREVKYEQLGY